MWGVEAVLPAFKECLRQGRPSLPLVRPPARGVRCRAPLSPSLPPALQLPPVYVIIGIFCLASSTGLYSCLSPLVQRLPFCKCR